jgi:hypothetical protein
MALTQKFADLQQDVKTYGLGSTFSKASVQTVRKLIEFRSLTCVVIDVVNADFLKTDGRYTCTFLTPDRILELAKHSENDLTPIFLDEVLAKNDECYAILDGNTLASYGWYASTPTNLNCGLRITFAPQYAYMHHGHTLDAYRGQRLHAVGMTRALQEYLTRGYKGLVSIVDTDNLASLKSCYRMGYRKFGTIYVTRMFDRYNYRWLSSPGCQAYAFGLEKHVNY